MQNDVVGTALMLDTVRVVVRRERWLVGVTIAALACALVFMFTERIDIVKTGLGTALLTGCAGIGLASLSGLFSHERASGLMLFWSQKQMPIQIFYMKRFVRQFTLLCAWLLFVGAAIALIAAISGLVPYARIARITVAILATGTLLALSTFAFSAWRVRRDSMAAMLTAVGVYLGMAPMAFADEGFRRSFIINLAFPLDALAALGGGSRYPDYLLPPGPVITGHFIAWTLIAIAGLYTLKPYSPSPDQ